MEGPDVARVGVGPYALRMPPSTGRQWLESTSKVVRCCMTPTT